MDEQTRNEEAAALGQMVDALARELSVGAWPDWSIDIARRDGRTVVRARITVTVFDAPGVPPRKVEMVRRWSLVQWTELRPETRRGWAHVHVAEMQRGLGHALDGNAPGPEAHDAR